MSRDKIPFSRLLTRSGLKGLAGDLYFERGAAYFRSGAVVHLALEGDGITARVQGTSACPYSVRYWIENRSLRWGCACPLGSEGAFCKHLVAAGLAWTGRQFSRSKAPAVTPEIRALLKSTHPRALLEIVGRRAAWDEGLLAELELAARAAPRQGNSKRRSDTGLPGPARRPAPHPISR